MPVNHALLRTRSLLASLAPLEARRPARRGCADYNSRQAAGHVFRLQLRKTDAEDSSRRKARDAAGGRLRVGRPGSSGREA